MADRSRACRLVTSSWTGTPSTTRSGRATSTSRWSTTSAPSTACAWSRCSTPAGTRSSRCRAGRGRLADRRGRGGRQWVRPLGRHPGLPLGGPGAVPAARDVVRTPRGVPAAVATSGKLGVHGELARRFFPIRACAYVPLAGRLRRLGRDPGERPPAGRPGVPPGRERVARLETDQAAEPRRVRAAIATETGHDPAHEEPPRWAHVTAPPARSAAEASNGQAAQ